MLFAGLFEYWRSPEEPADAEMTKTCTIITTTPSEDMDEIHDRMPVVLELDDVETWINVREHEPESDCNCSYPHEAAHSCTTVSARPWDR